MGGSLVLLEGPGMEANVLDCCSIGFVVQRDSWVAGNSEGIAAVVNTVDPNCLCLRHKGSVLVVSHDMNSASYVGEIVSIVLDRQEDPGYTVA